MNPEMRASFPSVCVVAPVYNEADSVGELVQRITEAFDDLPRAQDHLLLLVDDGSHDATWDLVQASSSGDSRVSGIALSRNFGHQAAVSAGLAESTGDVVIVMDGDLQDDPAHIPTLVEEHLNGFDVVYVVRTARSESRTLRVAYWLHYRLLERLSKPSLPVDAGDFGLMSRRVVDLMNRLPERQRYVRGLRAWIGFEQKGVELPRSTRFAGDSKYNLLRLVNLALDGLFSFSIVPIRLALVLGTLTVSGGFAYGIYALAVRLTSGAAPPGFTSLVLLMIVLSGTILLFLGVIGEYVGRIYEEVKARPVYVIAERTGGRSNG